MKTRYDERDFRERLRRPDRRSGGGREHDCAADLLLQIRERIRRWDLPQEQAAARLHLTRPRLNDLMRGKLDKFSLDALVNIATAAGFVLRIHLEDAA